VPLQSSVAHRSATLRGATTTRTGTTEAVINGKLFSCPDFSEAIQEDLPPDSAHRQIRIASMIDELRATSSYCWIDPPTPIQMYGVHSGFFSRREHPCSTAHDFPLADAFAGILDDPLAQRDHFFCEHAKPFDARPANDELKADELRVETRNVKLSGHIMSVKRGSASQQSAPPLDSRRLPTS